MYIIYYYYVTTCFSCFSNCRQVVIQESKLYTNSCTLYV